MVEVEKGAICHIGEGYQHLTNASLDRGHAILAEGRCA